MAKKYTISDVQDYVIPLGGSCLSKEYIDLYSPLKWRCERGHTWDADFQVIRQGSWCPACLKKQQNNEEKLEAIRKKIVDRGGKLLADQYVNGNIKLLCECDKGHQWNGSPSDLIRGSWCPYCAGMHRTIVDMHQFAEKRGGKCLSEHYVDGNSILTWECAEGHVWEAAAKKIANKLWCPKCGRKSAGEKHKLSIEQFHKIAAERGGKLISTKYIDLRTHLLWECAKGHQWKAAPSSVYQLKSWCPHCLGRVKTLEDMKQVAAKKGGKCLSTEYINSLTPLLWECAKGHQWKAKSGNILNSNSWCPHCQRKSISDMHELAASKGGFCLSEQYRNKKYEKLTWKCKEGHVWDSNYQTVRQSWCPKCGAKAGGEKKRYTIEKYQQVALSKGGKLLSEKAPDIRTPLLWECAKGHQWMARPKNVIRKTWCPQCSTGKRTIADIQELAAKNGVKCLSKDYMDIKTKMEWECSEGHVWKATMEAVSKSWCIVCNKIARKEKNAKLRAAKT